MTLTPPMVGGLFGLGAVLLLALLISRSNARTHQRRMDLLRQKIERRQAKLQNATQEHAHDNSRADPDEAND